jgi:hypothetical protein
VIERQAGTASFALQSINQATLTYTVDGVPVGKSVERQTWANENYTGIYAGGYSIRFSSCNLAIYNGVQEIAGLLTINQNGTSFAMASSSTAVAPCWLGLG